MRMHHLGIATNDLDATASNYGDVLGLEVVHEERFDGLRIAFLSLDSGYVELLEPVEPSGPIDRFLDRNGPGIHHVAFEVDDLDGLLSSLGERGVELVDKTPRPGAWGHRVAFVHPRGMGGVLVEFVET